MPETLTQPAVEQAKPQWVKPEDIEKFEKMIFKTYTKKGDKTDSKKFFYKIIGLHPTVPGGVVASTDECQIAFEVQKYFRNKFTETTVRDAQNPQASSKEKVNLQVDAHEMRNGKWILVDPEASFFMDAKEFKEKFELDTTE